MKCSLSKPRVPHPGTLKGRPEFYKRPGPGVLGPCNTQVVTPVSLVLHLTLFCKSTEPKLYRCRDKCEGSFQEKKKKNTKKPVQHPKHCTERQGRGSNNPLWPPDSDSRSTLSPSQHREELPETRSTRTAPKPTPKRPSVTTAPRRRKCSQQGGRARAAAKPAPKDRGPGSPSPSGTRAAAPGLLPPTPCGKPANGRRARPRPPPPQVTKR